MLFVSGPALGVMLSFPLFPLSFRPAAKKGNITFCTSALFHGQNILFMLMVASYLPEIHMTPKGVLCMLDNVLFASLFCISSLYSGYLCVIICIC